MQSHANSALDASVLVLNRLFMAVHVISVRRAFVLLCKDLAEVVSQEEADFEGGKISMSSPIGKALMGHVVGDSVQVKVPAGILNLKILEITRLEHRFECHPDLAGALKTMR